MSKHPIPFNAHRAVLLKQWYDKAVRQDAVQWPVNRQAWRGAVAWFLADFRAFCQGGAS